MIVRFITFCRKKKQKINCKTSRAHTKYCSAHERQNVLRRTTSSVEMKLTMTRTRRQTQRKHNTPYYPLSTHTHTCMCVYNAWLSFSMWVCACMCVCVRQCAYVCCCSCCCFSCCGALEMLSLFTSSLSQVFSAPVCVEENRLCFSVGDLIWGNSFRTCNWPLKGASRWFQKILTNVNNSLYFQFWRDHANPHT